MAQAKLGIVAGSGPLPARIVSACRATGRDHFVLALQGFADAAGIDGVPQAWIRLGEGGKGIALLQQQHVGEIVFAGAVRRPGLKELRPDLRTAAFLARLGRAWIGDDSLHGALVRELEREGFRVVAPDAVLSDLLAVERCYGRVSPDAQALADIARGIEAARALGRLDVGQAAIVQNNIVLGVEGAEGTDALIERCAALHRDGPGGVLVKTRKPGQERRIDLPAIGPDTVARAASCRLGGIAVEAGGALVIDRDEVIRRADAAGLFVVGVAVPE